MSDEVMVNALRELIVDWVHERTSAKAYISYDYPRIVIDTGRKQLKIHVDIRDGNGYIGLIGDNWWTSNHIVCHEFDLSDPRPLFAPIIRSWFTL